MALLTLTDVAKTYDAHRPLFTGITLAVRDADRIGLIGPNGSGKSTLLRILAGLETPDAGLRVVRRGAQIGYLEQAPTFDPGLSVREIVRGGLAVREALVAELEGVHAALSASDVTEREQERLLAREVELSTKVEGLGGHDVEHQVEAMIAGVGLGDPEATSASLSGGEGRRAALARLLIAAPDLLLLDEPTNHLDAFVVAWLEEELTRIAVPLVLVTHDRYLLDRVVDRIVEIDRGSAYAYEGDYSRYVELRAARLESEQKTERTRLNLLRRETAWMRRGPPARTTKAKGRIARYEALVADVPKPLPEELELAFPPGPRLGSKVVRLRGVSHAFGERSVLPRLDLEIEPAMRLGVVGPNGAGKSTLLAILLGRLAPSTGEIAVGETVRFATIDQKRSDLDPTKTVVQEVAGRSDHVQIGSRKIHVAGFLDRFLFPGPRKDVPIGSLSGGERGRVLLAKLLLTGANVLVLDEPTNDLDLVTLRALEEALVAFEGAVVVVSHDRWFLDRVATHVLHLDGAGGAHLHTGDMSSLLERLARERAEAAAANAPTRPAAKREGGKGTASAGEGSKGKKRLASWEKRELAELEGRVAELERGLAALDVEIADPALYSRNAAKLRELYDRRSAASAALEQALARWEELAERDA